MKTDWLRHFLMLAEEGSFHRAALRLFLTPQALSKSIGNLERHLGATLFVRGPVKGLTPAGEVLCEEAAALLAAVARAEARVRAAHGGHEKKSCDSPDAGDAMT